MTWKPVKSQSARSPQGQRHARELDRIKAPFIKRRNGDGSVSMKKGATLVERAAPKEELPLPDGFYSLGYVAGKLTIVGSRTARGRFEKRGSAGASNYVSLTLAFYGRGYGLDPEDLGAGVAEANFDGVVFGSRRIAEQITRDGRRIKTRFTHDHTRVHGGWLYQDNTYSSVQWAGTVRVGESHLPVVYFSGLQIIGGQFYPAIYVDPTPGRGDVVAMDIPIVVDQMCAAPSLHVVNTSGKMLLMQRYMRPTYTPSASSPALCPGIFFLATSDHGNTWSAVDPGGMFTDASTLQFLPPLTEEGAMFWRQGFNNAVYRAELDLFPTDPANSSGIAFATVPVAQLSGGLWTVKYRSKIGTYSGFSLSAGFQVGEYPNVYTANVSTHHRTPFTFNGTHGVLYIDRTAGGASVAAAVYPQLKWTDGLTSTLLGAMPRQNWATGAMCAIDGGRIVCVMYDGEHSLYELSPNLGGGPVWAKRATISSEASPPSTSSQQLSNFAYLTYLREDGRPVSATPSAPWMTDSRKRPPE